MRRGFSLPELALVVSVAGLLLVIGLPRLRGALDRIAVSRAAGELTTTLAVARHLAISYGMRTRVTIRPDSLAVDSLGRDGWAPWGAFPGPATHGVSLTVSNRVVQYNGIGIGWGLSNTRVVLRRGSHSETITTSRLGRVKRW
jgi:prepilin-type N-terminal cleavage/methylation domain-containing protein